MASPSAALPRNILRSARRGLQLRLQLSPSSSLPSSRLSLLPQQCCRRSLSTSRALRAGITGSPGGNAPPMEPHKQRPQDEIDVGELEGTEFRIEPMRRTGENDVTMRARLVYQSRKRGTLEADLLLSTFADKYLASMTRAQMAQYDRFLDENDWDIYYWATQEPPSSSGLEAAAETARATLDTSSPDYAGGAEAAEAEASPISTGGVKKAADAESVATGGSTLTGDAGEGKEDLTSSSSAAGAEPYRSTGEWAQTVGTFKPAYRPVPRRWRDSEVLILLRDHVKVRAKEQGGMAFMPALRNP
ncbi:Succinate dehydrogenase assembly factor 2 mitochondrial [Parahypoxylon ruwenzoriense]